ncbi:MAG: hypothetical protein ABH804_00365 [archaeon]
MSSMNDMETKGIKAVMIVEVIGKPPEHLTETLEKIIADIDAEKGVQVMNKNLKEPAEIEKQKGFYSSFAEIEVEVEEVLYLAVLMFKYMPANIEIISPELIALSNNGWNDIFNELTRRLHGYDEVAKILQYEKYILEKKLRGVLEEQKPSEKKGKKQSKKK